MSGDPRDEIATHIQAMRALAISLTHDPTLADDIVQDAAIKAWVNFGTFQTGTNLKAWLFTILRNTFYSELRKRRLQAEPLDDLMAQTLAVKGGQEDALVLRDFLAAFRLLSLEQREALLLVGALGFSYDEAAEVCAVPVGTIKSRTHRGRLLLSQHMELLDRAAAP